METTSFETTGLRSLEPSIRTIWTMKYALFWGILVFGFLFYEFVQFVGGNERAIPMGLMTGGVFIVGSLVTFFIPRLRYKYWRFALRSEELYLERGILNRVRTIVPLRRIQHVDVSQDIIEREFDLGKLIVHTAGSRSSDVVVPGLQYKEAEQLRDDVKKYVLEDAL